MSAQSPGELLHNGRLHRVHRIRGKDGESLIVKTRTPGAPDSAGFLDNELRMLAHLRGVEGCAQLLEGSAVEGRIVLRNFGGVPLDASGLTGALDLGKFLALSENLARTLAAIHDRGVIHRAIEPAHILVRPADLAIEFIGFGAATTFVESPAGDWRPERILGNPLWISPEQTGRMNRTVDWRADLYSLGAVLYAVATGKPPFEADSVGKILHAHMARLPEPPSAIAPWMPQNLESIILKLLAKEPDRRYQGAVSLARDLGLLRQALAQGKPVAKIPLPPSDIPARPRSPSRLHGRLQEMQRLSAAFESVGCGGARQVFVAGRSGTGKSSLIAELRRPTALAEGFFIGGKCEQFGQGKPFHAPAAALEHLAARLLDRAGRDPGPLRERLSKRLGEEVTPLCAVAPTLKLLLDSPLPAEESPAPEAQARLVALVVDFLAAVCSPEHPVVFVLDDLQWADAPTLALVKQLMGDTRLEGFLLVGAYRDDEVGPAHPLSALLQRTDTPGRAREVILLENLGSASIAPMLEDMLGSTQNDLPRLAEQLADKTGGNPHFTVQLVDLLWREGHLRADIPTARWRWNADAIQRGDTSSDVADLLARDLGSLPPSTRETLSAMACLGSGTDLGALALAAAMDLPQTAALLEPALANGVLTTCNASAFQSRLPTATARFCHDRMQQAALRLAEPQTLKRLRLDIARRLSGAPDRGDLETKAAWCYGHALDLLISESERAVARGVFLRAAETSLASGDYPNAENLLRHALGLLPPNARAAHRDEEFRLLARLHLACYCRGALDEADRIFHRLEKTADSPALLALPACTQVMSLSNRTRYGDAVRLGCDLAEKLIGIKIPSENSGEALAEVMKAFRKLVESGSLELLGDRPASDRSGWSHAARVMNRMIPAAFFTNPQLACWLALRCGCEWMENGYRPAFLYPMSCAMLATIALDDDYATGWRAASRALRIGQSRGGGVETARSEHVFGLFGCHWFEPLEHSLAHARSAFDTLSRTDELEFACYTFFTSQAAVLETSGNLEAVRREVEAALEFARATGNLHATQSFLAFRQTVRALEGSTATRGGFDDHAFREEEHLARIASNPMALAFFHTYRAFTACVFHDASALDSHAEAAVALLPYITGFYPTALAVFLHSLALVERIRSGRKNSESLERLAQNQRWLAARAADQPGNFAVLRDLVEAERLDATGNSLEAFSLFESARGQALTRERPWHLAIATERAARCFERRGLSMASRPLFAETLALHQRLGAHGKAAALVAEWPFLRDSAPPESAHSLALAFQSLAAQETPKALAEQTARWLAEFTGATDVRILILDAENRWRLEAALSGGKILPDADAQKNLVAEMVLALGSTHSTLLISNNARDDDRFLRDPYFRNLPICSLLILPVPVHSKTRALAVMENRLVASAFHQGSLENVRTLCSQFALSLAALRNRQALEDLVARRNREIQAIRDREESFARTAYELTENIPVGTYVLEMDSSGAPRFTFVSERWLKILDLRREEVLADHSLAVRTIHPDDQPEFNRLNAETLSKAERFFWEGRIIVRGQTRWVSIESMPRHRSGGGTLWEGVMIDITERKLAEEKIARSEAALHNALDTLPFAVGLCGASESHADPAARIVFLNRHFIETFGYDTTDLPSAEAWARLAYPDEDYRREVFAWWDTAVQRLIAGHSRFERHESRAMTKHGLFLHIIVSATTLEDKLVISFQDITERKRAEEQLRFVLDNIPVAVATTTLDSQPAISFLNESFTRFFGYTLEDIPTVGDWAVLAYPDEAYRRETFRVWDAAVAKAVETRGSVESMEFRVTCKNGEIKDVLIGAVVLEDRVLVSFVDITARKLAEKKLAESEESLRQSNQRMVFAAEAAGLGFWSRDLTLRLEEWDDQMHHLYGVRREEFDGRWEPLVHPEDLARVEQQTSAAISTDGHGNYEYRIVRPDGAVLHIRGISKVIFDLNGRAVREIGVNYDITAQKEAEEELAKARENERQAEEQHRSDLRQKLKTALTASAIAHEIYQPLGRMILTADLVRTRAAAALRKDTELSRFVAALSDDARLTAKTISKMKALLRNVKTPLEPMDLAESVRDAVLYNSARFRGDAVEIVLEEPHEAFSVLGEADQIAMALNNLLENAAQSLAMRPPPPAREILIQLVRHPAEIEIRLGDSGPGIPEAEIPDLLLKSTKAEGSGLGLFLVQTTMENHNGRLEIGRSPLGGAEVRMIFPAA